jgi:hypothetical protein
MTEAEVDERIETTSSRALQGWATAGRSQSAGRKLDAALSRNNGSKWVRDPVIAPAPIARSVNFAALAPAIRFARPTRSPEITLRAVKRSCLIGQLLARSLSLWPCPHRFRWHGSRVRPEPEASFLESDARCRGFGPLDRSGRR